MTSPLEPTDRSARPVAGSIAFASAIGGVAGAALAGHRGRASALAGGVAGAATLGVAEAVARARQRSGEIPPLWQRIAVSSALAAPLGWAAGRYQERYWHERMFATVEELRAVAEGAGIPMATLAVRWVLANPVVTAPILGASRPDQLAAAVAALDEPLPADLLRRLDELTVEYRSGDHQR